MFESPSKADNHYKNNSLCKNEELLSSPSTVKSDNKNTKDEYYYSTRIAPTHSNVPVYPVEIMGPPPRVSPYFYMTDKDFEIINGKKNDKNIITTVSRLADNSIKELIMNRVATSPLRSCMKNVDIKVSKGGVSVSFDPWKENPNLNDNKLASKSLKESEFKQQFNIEGNSGPNFDEEQLNTIVKSIGVQPKIDPKVQKFVQRDLELAKRKQATLENQRRSDK